MISQCKINWFTWLHNSCTWCLFYKDSLSQDCKLYLRTKHVTLSCLSQPITVYQYHNWHSPVSTQWHCTVQCYLKVKHDRQKSCYFDKLLYLTSPILTECGTQLSLTTGAISTVNCYSPLILHLGTRRWWRAVSRSGSFICGTRWKEDYVSFCSDLQDLDKRKAPFPCLIS